MPHSPEVQLSRQATVLRILLPFAAGYFLSYLFRVVNAVIGPAVARELQLDAGDLGLLTSAYFLTFAAMQIPLGVMLDSWGPRRSEATLLLLAVAGAAIFSVSTSLQGLVAGRALIGLGVSACLMAAFKAFVLWFPPQRLPQINGIQMAAGGFGALTAAGPTEWLLHYTDWRMLFGGLAVVTLLIAAGIFFTVPEHPQESAREPQKLAAHFAGIREVFGNRLFWTVAPLTVASQAGFLAIQSLWTGPWLRDVAGLESAAAVGTYLTLIAACMVGGFLVIGWITTRLSEHGIQPMQTALVGMSAFLITELLLAFFGHAAPWLLLLFGFLGTTGIVPYAVLSQSFPKQLAGRVNTALNLLVFVCAFAAQWGVGAIIDLWAAPAAGGYAAEGYRWAFVALAGTQLSGLIWYLRAKK